MHLHDFHQSFINGSQSNGEMIWLRPMVNGIELQDQTTSPFQDSYKQVSVPSGEWATYSTPKQVRLCRKIGRLVICKVPSSTLGIRELVSPIDSNEFLRCAVLLLIKSSIWRILCFTGSTLLSSAGYDRCFSTSVV